MIDLIRDEVWDAYPENRKTDDSYFNLHCSPRVAEHLKQEFFSRTLPVFSVDRNEEEIDPAKATLVAYHIPGIGRLNVLMDMLQGYRIELIENQQITNK